MSMFTICARIGHDGQEIYGFSVPATEKTVPTVKLSGNVLDDDRDKKLAELDGRAANGVKSVALQDGTLHIKVVPFSVRCAFELTVGKKTYTAEEGEFLTDWADRFEPMEEGRVKYRLYAPEEKNEARPLILFLHGGGEQGSDNKAQVYNCFGAAKLAESYPDCYVLAPQAPGSIPLLGALAALPKMTFANSDRGPASAWSREYLALVCDIVRRMIREGRVNPERVYVTGMSMGGGGTLRALNVGGDLFAAAVVICPTMTPETYDILRGLTHTKIWVTCAYLDHTPYRHKYIVDAIMALKDAGNQDAKLTIFAPEELEKYGISVIEDMTLEQKAGWNHACWVPTYYNEHGVMSWMMNQRKV